jgi:hypothetical protein
MSECTCCCGKALRLLLLGGGREGGGTNVLAAHPPFAAQLAGFDESNTTAVGGSPSDSNHDDGTPHQKLRGVVGKVDVGQRVSCCDSRQPLFARHHHPSPKDLRTDCDFKWPLSSGCNPPWLPPARATGLLLSQAYLRAHMLTSHGTNKGVTAMCTAGRRRLCAHFPPPNPSPSKPPLWTLLTLEAHCAIAAPIISAATARTRICTILRLMSGKNVTWSRSMRELGNIWV